MKKFSFLTLSLALCTAANARDLAIDPKQTNQVDALVTDRPDFTESPQTVPAGRIQIEGGVTYERSGQSKTTTFGETLIRVATGDKSELRIGLPSYLTVRGDGRTNGLDDGSLGVKFALAEGSGYGFKKPALGVIIATSIPSGAKRIAERTYAPEVKLAAGVDLNERWSLGTNLGVARPTDGEQRFTQLVGTAALAYSVSEKVGAYFEGFAFSKTTPSGDSARYLNTGLTYLVNPDLQLDARLGFGINNDVSGPDYFYGIGVARRF
jgi:hypothetical protein